MDKIAFRNCLGKFATGVTVITCDTDNGNHGFTANSFTSVSMDPPLILVSVDRKTKAIDYLKNNKFTVNILKADQKPVAMHFAGHPQDPFPTEWIKGQYAPRLKDSLAYFECEPWREYDGGDHVLFIGKVKEYASCDDDALVFHSGKFSEKLMNAE